MLSPLQTIFINNGRFKSIIPNDMTRAQLVDFARNAATQVANGKVSGLLAEQILAFAAGLAADADDLAAADAEQVALRAASIAATRKAQDISARSLRRLQSLRYAMKAARCGAAQYDAVGFDPPVKGRQMVKPKVPFDLSAAGYSNGVNVLKYDSRDTPNTVAYIIEAKIGDADRYQIVGTSKNRSFKHTGVKPGVQIQYRVGSQATRGGLSEWSNEAVVYGFSTPGQQLSGG